jgi:hypothetical protein
MQDLHQSAIAHQCSSTRAGAERSSCRTWPVLSTTIATRSASNSASPASSSCTPSSVIVAPLVSGRSRAISCYSASRMCYGSAAEAAAISSDVWVLIALALLSPARRVPGRSVVASRAIHNEVPFCTISPRR